MLTETVRFSLHAFAEAEVEFGCEAQLVNLVVGAVGRVAPLDNLDVWKRGREFALPSGRRIDLLCKERDRGANRHVPKYLTRQRDLPLFLPEEYVWGSHEEATLCAADLLDAWESTPGATAWLKAETRTRK